MFSLVWHIPYNQIRYGRPFWWYYHRGSQDIMRTVTNYKIGVLPPYLPTSCVSLTLHTILLATWFTYLFFLICPGKSSDRNMLFQHQEEQDQCLIDAWRFNKVNLQIWKYTIFIKHYKSRSSKEVFDRASIWWKVFCTDLCFRNLQNLHNFDGYHCHLCLSIEKNPNLVFRPCDGENCVDKSCWCRSNTLFYQSSILLCCPASGFTCDSCI